MTIVFLLLVATVRLVSLAEQREELLRQAQADVALVAELLQIKSTKSVEPGWLPDIEMFGDGLTAHMALMAIDRDGVVKEVRGNSALPIGAQVI